MYKGKKIAVVVPAYNEEILIEKTLVTMPGIVDLIVVINDGSKDRTAAIVEEIGRRDPRVVQVINEKNIGLGASIWKGYGWCDQQGADIFVVMAGDAQMAPEDLPALLDPIAGGRADYSKGNRLQNDDIQDHMPLHRFFGNAVLTILTKFATGYWHSVDPQCGYTALSRDAFRAMNKKNIHTGYGYNADILIRLNLINCRLAEVPVQAIYGEAKSGIKLHKYIPKVMSLLIRLFFMRMRQKYLWAFHPLLLFYFFGAVLLFTGASFGFSLVFMKVFRLGGVSFGSMLLGAIFIIMGFQSLFFGMWMDMQDNKRLDAFCDSVFGDQ